MPEPDKSVVNELKQIDKDLTVKWDKHVQRFMVYHKDRRNITYPVVKVQYKDGSFKPLDKRTVKALKYSNRLRQMRPQDILYQIDKDNEKAELEKDKKLSNDIKSITKDNWRQMFGVPVVGRP